MVDEKIKNVAEQALEQMQETMPELICTLVVSIDKDMRVYINTSSMTHMEKVYMVKALDVHLTQGMLNPFSGGSK